MDVSLLPELVVENIAQYLNFEDVCACSQVNSGWREAFDFDRVWKRFCTFHSKYFDKQISKLNCTIDIDYFEGCSAKERIFKELFVQRNMLRGNVHITEVDLGSTFCDSVVDGVDSEGNHWMFVSCMDSSEFEREHEIHVWKLNEEPVLHTRVTSQLGKVKRILNSDMKLNNDKFFYIHQDTVLVYEFAPPSHQLVFLHKILFTPLATFPHDMDLFLEMSMIYINNLVVGFLYTSLHVNRLAPPFFHVWDEDGTLVCKEYGFSFNPREYQDFNPDSTSYPIVHVQSNGTDRVVVVYQRYSRELNASFFTVRVFSTVTLHYVNFVYQKKGNFIAVDILQSVVSVMYLWRGGVTVMCSDTALPRHIQKIRLHKDGSFHQLVPNKEGVRLVILENNIFSVHSAISGKKLNQFKVAGKELNVTMLRKNLMLLGVVVRGLVTHEVWNFEKGQKLYTLNYNAHFGYKLFEQNCYAYSYIRNYNSPPKLVAYKDPMMAYSHSHRHNKLFIASFW